MEQSKWCPVCNSTEWNNDCYDGIFVYCRECLNLVLEKAVHYPKAPNGKWGIANWLRAVADARETKMSN